MTSTDLIESDLHKFLDTVDGNYVTAYDDIVAEEDRKARSTQIVNRSARVERFKNAVATLDRKELARVNRIFKAYLAQVRKNAALSALDEPRQLSVIESEDLMQEALDLKEIEALIKARWEEIKRLTFGHMTEQFAEDGDEFPEHVPGSIDVPGLGHRFAREAVGRKDPELQENVLKSLVSPEVWNKIIDVELVQVEKVNIGKLLAEANANPALLEDLRRSLKVGEWKSGRLAVRPL